MEYEQSQQQRVIPRRHLLFKKLYEYGDVPMYGTSHLREILLIDTIQGYPLETFDRLVVEMVNRRRRILRDLLQSGQSLVSRFIPSADTWALLLLNIYLERENFEALARPFQEIQSRVHNSSIDIEEAVSMLIYLVINNDDYMANWGNLPIFLNLPGNQDMLIYADNPEMTTFMNGMITKIIMNYKVLSVIAIKEFVQSRPFVFDANGLKIISLDASLQLYRGYKAYRGRLSTVKTYAWFGFDITSVMNYMLPPEKEDNLNYVAATKLFDRSSDYCSAIGGVAIYTTKRALKVLDFSDIETLRQLRRLMQDRQAPQIVLKAFDDAWQLQTSTFIRQSVDKKDFIVVEWLCSLGFDGYIAVGLEALNDEIMLCGVADDVEYLRDIDINRQLNFQVCSPPYSNYNLYLHYW